MMEKLTDQERDAKWLVWRDEDNRFAMYRDKKHAMHKAKEWREEGYHPHVRDQYPGQY